MKKRNVQHLDNNELRKAAEQKYLEKHLHMPILAYDQDDPIQTLYELHVRQIELEMQNEELKRANEEMETVRDKYISLYEYAPAGYVTLDSSEKVLECNQTFSELLGYPKKSLTGKLFNSFLWQEDGNAFYLHVKKVYQTHQSESIELRLVRKDLSVFWGKIQSRIDSDEMDCIRINISDISKLKQAELEILKAETLRQENIQKDKFIAILAHELKGPFNSFKIITEILNTNYNEFADKERIELLSSLYNGVQKTCILLENLLEWAKLQRNKVNYNPQTVSLNSAIESSISSVEAQAQAKKLSITNKVLDEIQVVADYHMLQTIFRNLLSNSIKFTPKNGSITIYACKTAKWIEISVQDTGIGISPDNLKKIFHLELIQSGVGTSGESGTSIGLTICKEFVQMHGGSIRAESVNCQGSTFTFSLPLYKNALP
jgi:PAS domain S-box-containing protein